MILNKTINYLIREIRWHYISKVNDQFGYVNNLLIVIAIAIVTFMVNLASKADYNLNIFEKIVLLFSVADDKHAQKLFYSQDQ